MNPKVGFAFFALCVILLTQQAHAEVEIFDIPSYEYQEATTKIDISEIPFYFDYITDGWQTVNFVTEQGSYSDFWSWSSPPFSEDANPRVLECWEDEFIFDLSRPVTVFGFELEPNVFSPAEFTVQYVYNAGFEEVVLATITRSVENRYGARLFAVDTGDEFFNRVKVTGEDAFAIAQVRYSGCPQGDFNSDCIVDAADYVVSDKLEFGPDAYDMWHEHFAESGPSGVPSAAAIPEPSTLLLAAMAGFVPFRQRRSLR